MIEVLIALAVVFVLWFCTTRHTSIKPFRELLVARVEWNGERDMTFYLSDGRAFRGWCTVWHEFPSGDSAPTRMSSWLCDRWRVEQWKRESCS